MANILKTEKKVAVISMLCEGASIRAVERITGIQKKTIGRLALRVGQACKRIMDEKMRGLTCKQIEVDEIWGFIGAKRNNAKKAGAYGDVWTFHCIGRGHEADSVFRCRQARLVSCPRLHGRFGWPSFAPCSNHK